MSEGLDCEKSDPFGQFSQTDEREAIMGRVPGGVSNGFQAVAQNIESYVVPGREIVATAVNAFTTGSPSVVPQYISPDVRVGRVGSLRLAR